ncbi:hypothetical protein H8356DRAFT_933132 [Neocallimastix lanati (nom. inval.)]|uniref:Pectate lyase n=1 Tax=Neocallimastix californiae TaxID=1754190 RepID=A0A1Y2FK90_9FUNG|nr:hypothetical protein H8356DRAFT_933132 [Neocallimastix sp. JGI-2020a]ORY83977.1 hypothetical protein LY90DRAFT_448590 [Neocallimastix californiae]|eukprot:ORY83977.1 hypothetical protein LY90DRAFT_448590 [Neocallimastix californiae]
MRILNIIGLVSLIKLAQAGCGGEYSQCGGLNFTGDKCCISGYTCKYFNDWYSQCVPGSSGNTGNSGNSGNTNIKTTTTKKTTTIKKTTSKAQQQTSSASASSSFSSSSSSNVFFPAAQKKVTFNEPYVIKAGQVYDGLAINGVWTSYGRGVTGQGDCKNVEGGNKDAVFRLESGATLKNVILGADAIEHVHCIGDGCTVENVWWDDVCEDALSLLGSTNTNAKFYLIGGGARDGSDKIVQHNSAGTVYIKNFTVSNSGKLYRACGNCKSGYQNRRDVVIENVNASNVGVLAGINSNYGDTATFINVNANGGNVCYTFTGNNNGKEPSKNGTQCKNQSDCVCK